MMSMPQQVVISGFGHDRPGIVAGLTHILMDHGCNIEDTSMTILGGEFAVILVAGAPSTVSVQALQGALDTLQAEMGFVATVKPMMTPSSKAVDDHSAGTLYLMRVSGRDRTGITYHATRLLAERGLSITDLQAHRLEGGEDGAAYLLLVEFKLPDRAMLDGLNQALKVLNADLGVESHLVAVESGVL